MPRGKNYVNNNKGISLQSNSKKNHSMEPCFYGEGCTRKDCIYRHDLSVPDAKKTNEPCLAFLAGTCSFGGNTCKKRHPPKFEVDRLRAKYKSIRCRYGDECKTNSCLYTHPRDAKTSEPAAFLDNAAFPALQGEGSNHSSNSINGRNNSENGSKSAILPGSAWRAAPIVASKAPACTPVPPEAALATKPGPPPQHPPSPAISAQAPAWFPGNPQEENGSDLPPASNQQITTIPPSAIPTNGGKKMLNVNAKAWAPGS